MGLFSNTSEVKKAVWLYEAHRCSACGELNAAKQKLILRYRYDDIALSRDGADRKAAAEARMEKAARELIEKASDAGSIEKYHELNLLGRCSCGHKEPWSRMRSPLFEPVFNALVAMSVIALIIGVAQIFTAGSFLMLLPAAGLIGLTVGIKSVQRFLRRRREAAIAALDKSYIPFLTADEAAFRERFPALDADKLKIIEPSGYFEVNGENY